MSLPKSFLLSTGAGRRWWPRVCLLLGLTGAIASPAQTASQSRVDVQDVRFNLVAPNGAPTRWLEIDVVVSARLSGGRSQFLDQVQVNLDVGTRVPGGGYRYYHSGFEAVALENGQANFRFYLPPEVVKRDGLGGEAEFWAVAVSAGGVPLPVTARNYSVSLRSPDALRRFESSLATEAKVNDGVLVPQYLSPFAEQYPSDTPSPVRRR